MNLVIDTNILISALIKDSVKRKILMQSGWTFYYPKEAIKEILKYKELIKEKAKLSEEDFSAIYHAIITYINLIPTKRFIFNIEKANKIMEIIDNNDTIFIALALSIDNDGIWTDDSHFKQQDKIKSYTTEEIIGLFS